MRTPLRIRPFCSHAAANCYAISPCYVVRWLAAVFLIHLGVSFGSAFVWRARSCPCARTQVVGKRTRREAALAWCPRATVVMRRPFCPRVVDLRLSCLRERRSQVFRLGRLGRVAIALRIFWRIVAKLILFARVGSGEGFHVAASLPCSRRKSLPHCLWIGCFFGPLSLGGRLFDVSFFGCVPSACSCIQCQT